MKNKFWNQQRLLYVLLAGFLLFVLYLLSNLGDDRNSQRRRLQHEEFLKVVQESKRTRDELMRITAAPSVLHAMVLYELICTHFEKKIILSWFPNQKEKNNHLFFFLKMTNIVNKTSVC